MMAKGFHIHPNRQLFLAILASFQKIIDVNCFPIIKGNFAAFEVSNQKLPSFLLMARNKPAVLFTPAERLFDRLVKPQIHSQLPSLV